MAILTTSLEIYRGEDKQFSFSLSPVTSITGWTISFTVAISKNLTLKKITKTCSHTDEVNGVFLADLDAADTSGMNPGRYSYDVWRTNSGYATLLAIGTFTILPDVREPSA
jgi:hypothetical protein